MFNKQKGVVQIKVEEKTTRAFNYEKDGVNLKFNLDVNEKNGLLVFIELMDRATLDVKRTIEEYHGDN